MTPMRRLPKVPVDADTRYLAVKVLLPGVRSVCRWTVAAITVELEAEAMDPMPRLSAADMDVAPLTSSAVGAEPVPELAADPAIQTGAELPVTAVTDGPADAGPSRSVKDVDVVVPLPVSTAVAGVRAGIRFVAAETEGGPGVCAFAAGV